MLSLTPKGHHQILPWVNVNLTLGKCQRRRSCVMLYIIRLVLMRPRRLYYFVVTLNQKAVTTNEEHILSEEHIFV